MDCSLPGSSVHGILQARILEWVAVPFSRGSSQTRDQTQVSCTAGRFFTIWATREARSRAQSQELCRYSCGRWRREACLAGKGIPSKRKTYPRHEGRKKQPGVNGKLPGAWWRMRNGQAPYHSWPFYSMLRKLSNRESVKGSKWMEWLDLPSRKIPLVGVWRDRFKGGGTR